MSHKPRWRAAAQAAGVSRSTVRLCSRKAPTNAGKRTAMVLAEATVRLWEITRKALLEDVDPELPSLPARVYEATITLTAESAAKLRDYLNEPGGLPIWDQRPGETRAEAMVRHGAEGSCPFCDDEECPW